MPRQYLSDDSRRKQLKHNRVYAEIKLKQWPSIICDQHQLMVTGNTPNEGVMNQENSEYPTDHVSEEISMATSTNSEFALWVKEIDMLIEHLENDLGDLLGRPNLYPLDEQLDKEHR